MLKQTLTSATEISDGNLSTESKPNLHRFCKFCLHFSGALHFSRSDALHIETFLITD